MLLSRNFTIFNDDNDDDDDDKHLSLTLFGK